MVIRRFSLILIILLISAFPAKADMSTTIKLANYNIISHLTGDEFVNTNFTTAELDYYSKTKTVIGQFTMTGLISDQFILDFSRAYIKVRFPWFRLVAGKTRVSWGEGFVFNAGDLLFDGMSLDLNLSQSVLRDTTTTLMALSKYWGRYTFAELIFLPETTMTEIIPGSGVLFPTPVDLRQVSAGGRFHTRVLKTSIEAGYLYNGNSRTHNPYLSLHGDLFGFLDLYASGTMAIVHDDLLALFDPGTEVDEERVQESVKVSAGFFKKFDFGAVHVFNFTVEAGVYPFAEWEEAGPPDPPLPRTVYGLYVFPELSYSPSDTVSYQLRSLISPVEGCGVIFTGANWSPFQGFELGFSMSLNFGDENDAYGWERENDIYFLLQTSYKFGS